MDNNAKKRAEGFLEQMTLEEKVSQLIHNSKAIDRLGVTPYNWWNECLHGVARAGIATVFPQAIGMAAAWNSNLLHQVASAISDEARAKHHQFSRDGKHGIYQGLTYWSPNINIFRDPRWGRGMETYGEDPYLTARLAVSFIKGLQGNHPEYLKLVATPKHFAVHSGPEYSRHHFNAKPGLRDLWETYLPAFEACITEAGAYSIMGAYNRLFDEACCASNFLLKQVLRDRWGFQGFVVSDCGAITDIHAYHKLAPTPAHGAAMAIVAGTDLCCGHEYCDLAEAVMLKLIPESVIDTAVTRLIEAKIKLGMFDSPEKVPYAAIPYSVVDCEKHKKLAHKAALESIVLLKNENEILPFDKKSKTIALLGPNADNTDVILGNYHGTPAAPVSLLKGLKEKAGNKITVLHERGCPLADDLPFLDVLPQQYMFSSPELKVSGVKIEYFNNKKYEGKAALTETCPGLNHQLFANLPGKVNNTKEFSIKITTWLKPHLTGKYAIGAGGLTDFRLYVDEQLLTEFHTIWEPEKVYDWLYLDAQKQYCITLEINDLTSEAHVQKLLWAVPDEQMEQRALAVAARADVVVLAMGLSPQLEGEEMPVKVDGFKQGDRLTIDLPAIQDAFIKKVTALGKPTVLVLFNGCALAVNWAKEHVGAIVEAWYGGQAAGYAIADVLMGNYNPAGRLPVTFYKSVDQLPAFDDYSMQGRTYRYFKDEPLYKFGFGLSFSTFRYSKLSMPQSASIKSSVQVSVEVENCGPYQGEEVVQLYLSRPGAQDLYPIRSLQGFKRIHLKNGESKMLTFILEPAQFARISNNGEKIIEPGMVEISVGGSQPSVNALANDKVIAKTILLHN